MAVDADAISVIDVNVAFVVVVVIEVLIILVVSVVVVVDTGKVEVNSLVKSVVLNASFVVAKV